MTTVIDVSHVAGCRWAAAGGAARVEACRHDPAVPSQRPMREVATVRARAFEDAAVCGTLGMRRDMVGMSMAIASPERSVRRREP